MATKRELRLYGDLVHQYKPTFKTMFKALMLDWFAKRLRYKHSPNRDNTSIADILEVQKSMPNVPHKFAIVVDGTVAEIIVVNEVIANALSSKKMKIISFGNEQVVKRGMKYLNKAFIDDVGDSNEEN